MGDDDRHGMLVIVAHVLTLSEAFSVLGALRAAGISAFANGVGHHGAASLSVALGGLQVTVPIEDYAAASEVLAPMVGEPDPTVLSAFRRRVVKFVAAYGAAGVVLSAATALLIGKAVAMLYGVVLTLLSGVSLHVPAPPWRGDYYLAEVPALS